MSSGNDDPTIDDPQFAALLAACLESIERGETIDSARLQREHPEYADEILRFLEDRAQLDQLRADSTEHSQSDAERPAVGMGAPWLPAAVQRIGYFGDFVLLKELARGGMGVVYKARQETLGRIVAIKMILAGRLANERDVQRFQREARAAANLSHPNIVAVHEVGEHDGQHFFSMDYIDGESLSITIRDQPLSPRRACEILSIVARAVQYSHQQGTLHRDLKPSNVLLDQLGVPHVTDFGLAKVATLDGPEHELTTTGQVLGTPSYMSPEQAEGKHDLVGTASDIYSLGAVLYASLTGRPPFVADTVADTLLQVTRNEPASPRLLNPDLPKDLETICLKCLQKRPHERYGAADELADDLDRFLQGRPVSARPVGSVSKAIRWCRRNRAVAGLLAAVAFSLIAGTAVSTYFSIEASRRADSEFREKQKAVAAEEVKSEALEKEAIARTQAEQARDEAARSLIQSQWNVYKMQLFPMLAAWREGRFGELEQRLESSRPDVDEPDFRGWEWFLFENEVRRRSHVITPEAGEYTFLQLPDDGSRIALRRKDGQVDIRNADDLALLRTLPGSTQNSLAWQPGGELLAVPQGESAVQIWDVSNGELVRTLQTIEDTTKMANRGIGWSRNGERIAFGGFRRIDLFKLTGEHEKTLKAMPTWVTQIDWHPTEDNKLGVGGTSYVGEIDVDSDKLLWHWFRDRVPVLDVEWNPQGTHLASAWSYPLYSIRIFERAGRPRPLSKLQHDPTAIAWSEAGDRIVASSRGQTVSLWKTVDEPLKAPAAHTFNLHGAPVESLDWDWRTDRVVSVDLAGRLRSFAAAPQPVAAREIRIPFNVFGASSVRACPHDSDLFACWNTESAIICRVSTASVLKTFTGDDSYPAEGGHNDAQTEDVPQSGGRNVVKAQQGTAFTGLTWHPHEMAVVTLDQSGRLVVWNAESGEPQRVLQASSMSFGVSPLWSPDGRYLSAGSGQFWSESTTGSVDIWDADTGERRQTLDKARRRSRGAWSPDSRHYALRSTPDDGSVRIWDVEAGELIAESKPLPQFMQVMTYSNDGRLIAVGGVNGIIYFVDGRTGEIVHEVQAHSGPIHSLAWSPDGHRLLSSSDAKELKIWDTATADELLAFGPDDGFGEGADWLADGRRIVTLSRQGIARIWGTSEIRTADERADSLAAGILARRSRTVTEKNAADPQPTNQ